MVRIAEVEDIGTVLGIYAPYVEETTITFEYTVPTMEEFSLRFRNVTRDFPWLVWEENGRILGYVYASSPFERAAYRWCAEPSVYLAPEGQGRGIGRKLYEALEALLKAQGFQVLYALITGENTHSLGFHRHLGYETCGEFTGCGYKLGRWLNVIWMEKRLASVQNPSTFPVPWAAFRQDEQKIYDILDNLSLSEL